MSTQFFRILMFISSYFPLYIFLVILNFEIFLETEWFFWLMIILIVISIVTMTMFLGIFKANRVGKLEECEIVRGEVLSYFVTYVVPLTTEIAEKDVFIVNVLLFVIIGIIYVRNELLHLNPLIILLGYKQYSSGKGIVLTRLNQIELNQLKRNNEDVVYRELAKGVKIISRKK